MFSDRRLIYIEDPNKGRVDLPECAKVLQLSKCLSYCTVGNLGIVTNLATIKFD